MGVRTVTAVKGGNGEGVTLTGQVSAENEVALSFRIGGRILERFANVGDRVQPDQVLAAAFIQLAVGRVSDGLFLDGGVDRD